MLTRRHFISTSGALFSAPLASAAWAQTEDQSSEVAPLIEAPSLAYLYATIVILFGFVVYVPVIYYKKHLPFMSK